MVNNTENIHLHTAYIHMENKFSSTSYISTLKHCKKLLAAYILTSHVQIHYVPHGRMNVYSSENIKIAADVLVIICISTDFAK